jgi:Arc/MetJ-type ribon-helix-helix transcriptional regulator
MKKSIKVASKKRGRPPSGGRDPGVHIRLPEEMLKVIDALSKSDDISRSEAIRRLVELGLTVKGRPRQPSKARAETASAMASDQLDQLVDQSASTEQRANRKRRLLKGPEEFQSVRVDRVKQK